MAQAPVRLTWKHRLLLVGFGLLLVVLLELGLRLAGYGGKVPLLNPLPLRQGEGRFFEVHPKAAQIFFARSGPGGMSLVGSHRRDLVVLPKPPDVVRVVFVGASTVEGFPMPRNLTGARFLEAMLQEALPGRRVEVINLGVAAVASFPIRKLAVEALETMDPDLLLVYEAHNEFFGASGLASFQSMGRSVAAMQAVYFVRQLALAQVVEDLQGAFRRPGPGDGGERPDLIRLMAAADEIPPDGELHDAARRSLRENFQAIVREARERGVPAVLSTVVSNERDLAPLGPPGRAAAVYAEARALEAAGRTAEAAERYRRARDLDTQPWRASRDKNRLLRDLAADEGVPLADCEAAFAAASSSSGGATTWELFVDHVHPSLRGQALLAETFFVTIARHRLLPVGSAAPPDWRESAARLGAHPLELFLVAHKMAALFRVPPIGRNNEAAARRFAGLVDRLRAGADPVDAEAIRLWERGSAEAGFALPISYFGGVAALRAGQFPRAEAYLQAAVENAFPWSDERSAARLLGLIAASRAGADPASLRPRLAAALGEARQVATLPGQPTALHARSLAGLSTLAGEAEAARWESLARDRAAAAPPWERAFLRELPDPAALRP
jgi:lysophospholipase L1-like esterase